MGAKRPRHGTCAICLAEGKLSFEHVPPRAAFNDRPLLRKPVVESLVERTVEFVAGGKLEQLGAGQYTLCERCNSNTGAWYGGAYVEFVHGCARIAGELKTGQTAQVMALIHPLRVLKQVVTMFMSANVDGFGDAHAGMARFILNRESRWMPDGIDVFGFLTTSSLCRQIPRSGVAYLGTGQVHSFSEIAFPPVGFVMTFGTPRPHPLLFPLRHLGEYDYHDRHSVTIRPAKLEVNSWEPADYRTRDEIRHTVLKNTVEKAVRSVRGRPYPWD